MKKYEQWTMSSKLDRCPPLWRPQGRKWKEEHTCLFCGGKIVYKNDGIVLQGDTAKSYGLEASWYHLTFLLSFIGGKLGNPNWRESNEKD